MRKYLASAVALTLVSGFVFADGLHLRINDDVLRIDAGSGGSGKASVRELEDRIHRLERAVGQLQNEVFRLTDAPRPVAAAPKKVSCYLKTDFRGTYTSSGVSKIDARGKVLKECTDKNSAMFCQEDDIKCDE